MEGASGVLLSFAGGSDIGLFEVNEAANMVSELACDDANIIFGTIIDENLGDEVRVTVIATGFDDSAKTNTVAGRSGAHSAESRSSAADNPSLQNPAPVDNTATPAPSTSSSLFGNAASVASAHNSHDNSQPSAREEMISSFDLRRNREREQYNSQRSGMFTQGRQQDNSATRHIEDDDNDLDMPFS